MKKTALITGASKRLGKEIALDLVQKGFDIAIHYNQSKQDAIQLQDLIINKNQSARLYQCNLSDPNQSRTLITAVLKDFQQIDVLINNASVFFKSDFIEDNNDEILNTLSINFIAPYVLSQEYAKWNKSGNIINIIDTKINKLDTPYFLYTLSKKMLKDLTLMLAKTLAPEIRVNGINPGHILLEEKNDMSHLSMNPEKIPLKRNAHIKDILSAIDYILQNDFLTGQLLNIDGGEHLV